jgi:hypothetical protein
MRLFVRALYGVLALGILIPGFAWSSTPCDGVDRGLSDKRKGDLSREITKRKGQRIDVLQSFRLNGWTILYVETFSSDEPFFFYSRDPMSSDPVTMWSGAARHDEEPQIRNWTINNAPGIPAKLASCFAWHVTRDEKGWPPL